MAQANQDNGAIFRVNYSVFLQMGNTEGDAQVKMLHYLSPEEERAIKKSIPWAEIDSKIREVVKLANGLNGITTVQSCEGHVESDDDCFMVQSSSICFRATRQRTLEFLFEVVPDWRKDCVEVGIRYFSDGSFWLSIDVDPSRRRELYDLFKRFKDI